MHHFYLKRLTISMDNKMKEEIQKYTLNISESSFVRIAISNYLSKIKEDGPISQEVPSSIKSLPDIGGQLLL
jgi:hypothetical protein